MSGTLRNRVLLPWRIFRGHWRLFGGALCGLAVGLALPNAISITTRAILAWDASVIAFLGLSAGLFFGERLDRMAEDAAEQEEGEWTVFWLTIAAISFSFAAIMEEFAGTKDLHPGARSLHLMVVAATLLVSWFMTHTTFALRYAHEYYQVESADRGITGGLEFPGEAQPDYLDFLYFALVLGMTFQVSDVQITQRKFRRLATVHGLLSFVYNTLILALTVNLAAGLL
ncbi:MAG: DUF1345 domain-containing protein [Acetobacteraceae bacterium]